MIDRFACGTQTAVINSEHSICTASCEGTFRLVVDLSNMVAGDFTEFRVYQKTVPGGTPRVAYYDAKAGVQPAWAVQLVTDPLDNDLFEACGIDFTLKQVCGTGRQYAFKATRATEAIPIAEPTIVFQWPACNRDIIAWSGVVESNCLFQTSTKVSACNRAITSTLASAPVDCTATYVARGSFA